VHPDHCRASGAAAADRRALTCVKARAGPAGINPAHDEVADAARQMAASLDRADRRRSGALRHGAGRRARAGVSLPPHGCWLGRPGDAEAARYCADALAAMAGRRLESLLDFVRLQLGGGERRFLFRQQAAQHHPLGRVVLVRQQRLEPGDVGLDDPLHHIPPAVTWPDGDPSGSPT